jgi:hypothetical protein
MWHWMETESRFSTTSFWYQSPRDRRSEPLLDPSKMELLPIFGPPGVRGAIEGETLKAEKTGGIIQIQSGFNDLSRGHQLWWTESEEGGELTVEIPVQASGRRRVRLGCCFAKDYGIHRLSLNGKDLGVFDFYGEGVRWQVIDLGVHDLGPGPAILKVRSIGKNPQAVPGHMFGLDYILLEEA